jgi:L-fuconolactonase
MLAIDAHQHVWRLGTSGYSWLTPDAGVLYRDYRIDELLPQADAAGIDAVILVQADDDERDTAAMLQVAQHEPRVVGVVAYAPLHEPRQLESVLSDLDGDSVVVGVRNLTHDRPDEHWMQRRAFQDGVAIVASTRLALDLVGTTPAHLDAALEVAHAHPSARIVLDHLMKPPLGGDLGPWSRAIREAATLPNVSAKLSGLYAPGPSPASWTLDQVREVVDIALDAFGPRRLMVGSDWPVVTIAGGYARAIGALRSSLDGLDDDASAWVWGGTAAQFYRLDPTRTAAVLAQRPRPTGSSMPREES